MAGAVAAQLYVPRIEEAHLFVPGAEAAQFAPPYLDPPPAEHFLLNAETGEFVLTGQDAIVAHGLFVDAEVDSFVLTGDAASLFVGRGLGLLHGEFALAGQVALLEYGRKSSVGAGSFTFTGNVATLIRGTFRLMAGAGDFALTGNDVTLIHDLVSDFAFAAQRGTFLFSGRFASLEHGRRLPANVSIFTLTGENARLRTGLGLAANAGSFTVTYHGLARLEVGRVVHAARGLFTLAGLPVSAHQWHPLAAVAGAFLLTGKPATLARNRKLTASKGSFVLSGGTISDLFWFRSFSNPPVAVDTTVSISPFTVTSTLLGPLKIHYPENMWVGGAGLIITTLITAETQGYRVRYTISNPTRSAIALPVLQIRGHLLDDFIHGLTLYFGTQWSPDQGEVGAIFAPDGTFATTEQNRYPTTLLSPVGVGYDATKILGVSLEYPVLTYKHPVSAQIRKQGNWTDWAAYCELDGSIEADGNRVYTVHVRWGIPDADRLDWVHTLKPYRDFLHATYGSQAQYSQDLNPIWGRPEAQSYLVTPVSNPRGFLTNPPSQRVDLFGWDSEMDHDLPWLATSGHKKAMLWAPSGFYASTPIGSGSTHNYPSLVMHFWTAIMDSTAGELLRIPTAGVRLGYWWGDSVKYPTPYQFNPTAIIDFDKNNPTHLANWVSQLDLMHARGATIVGLDSLRKMPLWKAVEWVDYLLAHYSGTLFMAEPQCADILLMKIPFASITEENFPNSAPLLADYMCPGRMIVAVINNVAEEGIGNLKRYVGWGCTVLTYNETVTAHALASAVADAQAGWVLDWDSPPL